MFFKNFTSRIFLPQGIGNILIKYKPSITKLGWHLGIPIIFFVIMLLFFPSRGEFQLDTDEGINFMKAMLVERGYPLYREIWNDQPPLFTYMLVGLIKVFGNKVGPARLLVLSLSTILYWAYLQFLRISGGNRLALIGAVILFLLPNYLTLSVSTMIGLPSISFAMLSLLTLALWHRQRNYLWLILSGIALSSSVLIKIFTGFLAPIFIIGLLASEFASKWDNKKWVQCLFPPILWGITFSVFSIGLGLLFISPENINQLIDANIMASEIGVFNVPELTINSHLKNIAPTLMLAILGIVYVFQKRQWMFLYPFTWMVTAYLLLSNHAPVWSHQQLLVTIPAVFLAALATDELVHLLTRINKEGFLSGLRGKIQKASFTVIIFYFFALQNSVIFDLLNPIPSISPGEIKIGQEFLLRNMVDYREETSWIITDLPMYAYRARLPVPPNLAVFSMKRYLTGILTDQEILETMQDYQPEQVLFGRQEYPFLENYLKKNYRLILTRKDGSKLYIRKDIKQPTP